MKCELCRQAEKRGDHTAREIFTAVIHDMRGSCVEPSESKLKSSLPRTGAVRWAMWD